VVDTVDIQKCMEILRSGGAEVREIHITETPSDVDDFVVNLERAMAETKKHSIQFGKG
jgi:hypothetical protein